MKQFKMDVRVINKSKHPLPQYATELSAGMDIRANISESIVLPPPSALFSSDRVIYSSP